MPSPVPSNYATKSASQQAADRFALWVDGVGGYLVCLRDSVVLGQATADGLVDVPIQADISRRHVVVRRQQDSYFVEPLPSKENGRNLVKIEGREIRHATPLSDGDEIQLGPLVKLRYRRPHPLSNTARLEPVTYHRVKPGVEAVLLMSESCVLGPRWQNHVVCRDWATDVVLARQSGELFCRAMRPMEIDGTQCDGRGKLSFDSRVSGDDFSFCLERL
jgi:hypothetical protein